MPIQIDSDEGGWLRAFEQGQLNSVTTKNELTRVKAAARDAAVHGCPDSIRVSSGDVNDTQIKTQKEGGASNTP